MFSQIVPVDMQDAVLSTPSKTSRKKVKNFGSMSEIDSKKIFTEIYSSSKNL